MKLWLDDTRIPPDDSWTWVRTLQQAIETLSTGLVLSASLDHDLGASYASAHEDELCGGQQDWCGFCNPDVGPEVERNLEHNECTGYDVVLWMAENDVWPPEGIVVHSWNPVGAERMAGVVDRYGPYETRCQRIPADRP